ncbi:MAG TPA: hypothetical protein VGA78_12720 [Gemmatimonadales bacterium]
MVNSDLQPEAESVYAAVTRWAGHASLRLLTLFTTIGFGGAALVLLVDWRRWPLAGLLLGAGAIGTWGIVEQRAHRPHSRMVNAAEWTLAVVGTLIAMLAALGLFFWAMGPAPIL